MIDHCTERVVHQVLAVFVYVNMNTSFLRTIRGPEHCGRRRPHLKRLPLVIVKIDRSDYVVVLIRSTELIMKRFKGGRRDRLAAPSVIAPAVSTKVFGMRLSSKVPQVEMRIAAVPAVDASHGLPRLQRQNELYAEGGVR